MAKIRNWPTSVVLSDAASLGKPPTSAQITSAVIATADGATSEISPEARTSMRSALRAAATRAAQLRSTGDRAGARQYAAEAAASIADLIGDWQPPPAEPSVESNNPRVLAAQIPRH